VAGHIQGRIRSGTGFSYCVKGSRRLFRFSSRWSRSRHVCSSSVRSSFPHPFPPTSFETCRSSAGLSRTPHGGQGPILEALKSDRALSGPMAAGAPASALPASAPPETGSCYSFQLGCTQCSRASSGLHTALQVAALHIEKLGEFRVLGLISQCRVGRIWPVFGNPPAPSYLCSAVQAAAKLAKAQAGKGARQGRTWVRAGAEKKETPQERLKRLMSLQLKKQSAPLAPVPEPICIHKARRCTFPCCGCFPDSVCAFLHPSLCLCAPCHCCACNASARAVKKDTAAETAKKREQERERQEKLEESRRDALPQSILGVPGQPQLESQPQPKPKPQPPSWERRQSAAAAAPQVAPRAHALSRARLCAGTPP